MKKLLFVISKRPLGVGLGLISVLLAALITGQYIPLESLPPIPARSILVEAVAEDFSLEEMRIQIALPLEDALASLKGLESIECIIRDTSVILRLYLKWGQNIHRTIALAGTYCDRVFANLPDSVQRPRIVPEEASKAPFMLVALRCPFSDQLMASRLAEIEVLPRLRSIKGLSNIEQYGRIQGEYRLALDPEQLAAMGLDVVAATDLLSNFYQDLPAGQVSLGDRDLPLVFAGRPRSRGALADILLPSIQGDYLRVGALADISWEKAPMQDIFIDAQGNSAALGIYRSPGADPSRLSKEISHVFGQLEREHRGELEIEILENQAIALIARNKELLFSAGIGMLSVVIVLFLFLFKKNEQSPHGKGGTFINLFGALSVALAIPFAVACAVIVLFLGNKSFNAMSLGGAALGIGMLADTAILVYDALWTENGRIEAVYSVYSGSLSGLLTNIVVFLPLFLISGPMGLIYSELALSLIAALVGGWVYAFFVLPAMMGPWLKKNCFSTENSASPLPQLLYNTLLRIISRRPRDWFIALVLATGMCLLLYAAKGLEFLPEEKADNISLTIDFPAGQSLESIAKLSTDICINVQELPGIDKVYARAGSTPGEIDRRCDAEYRRERLWLVCKTLNRISEVGLRQDISTCLGGLGLGEQIQFLARREVLDEVLHGADTAFAYILAHNRQELDEKQQLIQSFLSKEARVAPTISRTLLTLHPVRGHLPFLNRSDISTAYRIWTEGLQTFTLEERGQLVPVRLISKWQYDKDDLLPNIPIVRSNTSSLNMSAIMEMEERAEQEVFFRKNRKDALKITGNLLPDELDCIKNGLGEKSILTSQQEAMGKYARELLFLGSLALALLWLLLAIWFESLKIPCLLMSILPMELSFCAPFLAFAGLGLNSGSILGLLVLMGTSVNAAIILKEKIDATSLVPSTEQVFEAASLRLRPVLMAALTTIVALIPLVIAGGSKLQQSMSLALLGGTFASLIPGYVILPFLFDWVLKNKKGQSR